MTPERWRRIKQLFDTALEQSPVARPAWLAGACEGDPDLHAEVESLLLAMSRDPDRFENGPALRLSEPLQAPDPEEDALIGSLVGPYRMVREIGRGGMGLVFEAHRADDQYRKRVAVKMVSRGRDTDVILRRFRRERQILARLQHRNIAALFDGGVTDSGQPFFAMELVEGVPITEYAESRRLPVAGRLQLFLQVCGAVQYAHRALVVHRDLKPGNILVAEDGTVKLLDFGIAKLLEDEEASEGDGVTQAAGGTPLTTAYASPEQVRGEPVTTATDLFSLGVVLYQLLAGRHPFNADQPGAEELRRRIREADPPSPSGVPQSRLGGLSRTARSDLDAIVLTAMRKEPERRYGTVEQLSDDIRRYLAGLPVTARPAAWDYRVRKYVRRNRVAVTGGAMTLTTLLAGLVATTWQAGVAARERDRARATAANAERVNQFLQSLLGAADPSWYSRIEQPGPQTTLGTILEAAGRQAETELAMVPEALGDVLRTVGRANQTLRRLDLALQQLRRAHELHLATKGAASTEVAYDQHELGIVHLARGELTAAEGWLRRSLATFRAAGDTISDWYGRSLNDLGIVLNTAGRPAEAEPFIRASVEHRRRLDSTSVANAILLGNLGLVLSQQGKLEEAERYYRESLDRFERAGDREYFEKGYPLGNLAGDLLVRGKLDEALALAREQLGVFSRVLGPEHPSAGYGWINLARALHARGQLREALEAVEQAEAVFRKTLPEGHLDFARSDLIRGQILLGLGRVGQAERPLRQALAIRRAKLFPGSTATADAEWQLARLLLATGRPGEAEPLLVSAHDGFRRGFGPGDPRTAGVRNALIELYDGQGKPELARRYREGR